MADAYDVFDDTIKKLSLETANQTVRLIQCVIDNEKFDSGELEQFIKERDTAKKARDVYRIKRDEIYKEKDRVYNKVQEKKKKFSR